MKFWSVLVAVFALVSSARAGVLVQFKMNNNLGTVDVELFDQDKPVTVSNFVAYVKSGAWHDNIIHRWIPNFVLQGGSYTVPHATNLMTSWDTNPIPVTSFPAIPFERDVGRFFSNVYGTIAMARVGTDTNSASHDWFFNLKDNVQLDTQGGGYTVFARVLRGTNTLNRFNRPPGTTNIYQFDPVNSPELPVFTTNRTDVFWVNVDITLLTAQIAFTRFGTQISWNSVEGRPNIVEYTTTFPANWQPVQTVTGTGAQMSIFDNSADPYRFYRIRIDYSN
jgi:cyclophilin family peptidyl-prolyl cis-trans isomerase